jgi:hypothetical protein
MDEDGSMARMPKLEQIAERHGLKIISVADLIAYRRRHERLVRRVAEANVLWGAPRIHGELLKLGIEISHLDDFLPGNPGYGFLPRQRKEDTGYRWIQVSDRDHEVGDPTPGAAFPIHNFFPQDLAQKEKT